MDPSQLDAVLFDLDGTLCQYTMGIEQAMTIALHHVDMTVDDLGQAQPAAVAYRTAWQQMSDADGAEEPTRYKVWRRLLPDPLAEDRAVVEAVAETYGALRTQSLTMMEGARAVLCSLRQEFGLALITNGPSDVQWEKIDALNLRPDFDVIVVSGDAGIHKPERKVFLDVLRRLEVVPQRSVYVGNSFESDVVGARNAGMYAVWINQDGHRYDPDVARPDAEIVQLSELEEILLCKALM